MLTKKRLREMRDTLDVAQALAVQVRHPGAAQEVCLRMSEALAALALVCVPELLDEVDRLRAIALTPRVVRVDGRGGRA